MCWMLPERAYPAVDVRQGANSQVLARLLQVPTGL